MDRYRILMTARVKQWLMVLGMLGVVEARAQQIQGVVTDMNGEPLPGVSIYEPEIMKGKVNGTVSFMDGCFDLSLIKGNWVRFSFVGYEPVDTLLDFDRLRLPIQIRLKPGPPTGYLIRPFMRIEGIVVDTDGAPLPGVVVYEKGTRAGTITNIDGSFSLLLVSGKRVKFATIGFITIDTVFATNKVPVVIRMKMDERKLGHQYPGPSMVAPRRDPPGLQNWPVKKTL